MPEIGRWGSVDPFVTKYPGWSPYNYVLNNPIKWLDPDGRGVGSGFTGLIFRQIIAKRLTTFKQPNPNEVTDYIGFAKAVAGKSLNDVIHEADTGFHLTSSAKGPNASYRDVQVPGNPKQFVDMRHFLIFGQIAPAIDGKGVGALIDSNFLGLLNELAQLYLGQTSAFQAEDFYSNFLGSVFFNYYYDSYSRLSIAEQIKQFFESYFDVKSDGKDKSNEREDEEDKDEYDGRSGISIRAANN